MSKKKSPIEIWREQKSKYSLLGKKGEIISLSRVNQPPVSLASFAPYWSGLVKISKTKKKTGQIISAKKDPEIGDKVVGVFRRMTPPDKEGIIEYGIKFKVKQHEKTNFS